MVWSGPLEIVPLPNLRRLRLQGGLVPPSFLSRCLAFLLNLQHLNLVDIELGNERYKPLFSGARSPRLGGYWKTLLTALRQHSNDLATDLSGAAKWAGFDLPHFTKPQQPRRRVEEGGQVCRG
jgi:hypothetical protein